MTIRVYQIIYEDYIITPLPNELFEYVPELGVVNTYDTDRPGQDTQYIFTGVYNFRFIKELILDPTEESLPYLSPPEKPLPEPEPLYNPDPPVLLSQICTCEDTPDPTCPMHRKKEQ